MQTKVCVIVNPVAGHGRAPRVWQRVEPLARKLSAELDIPYSVHFTEKPRHAEELARQAVERGFDRIAVIGGDGTLNEVGNGLVGSGAALAIVAAGSANDLIRTFPLSKDPAEAIRVAFTGHPRPMDVGLVETRQVRRHFVNMFGSGFDAEVAGRVNDLGPFVKAFGGTVATLICLVMTLFQYQNPRVRLRIDDQDLDVPNLVFSAVAIGRFIGGGMMLLPDAAPDDGLFDIMWAHDIGRLDLLRTVAKTYSGRHVEHPRVHVARGKRVTIESSVPLRCHVDGEVGGFLPATVELVRHGTNIILPAPACPEE